MTDNTVTVGSHQYDIRDLSTFDQWEVARLLRDALINLARLKKSAAEKVSADKYARALVGLTGMLTREESRAVIHLCMSVVYRKDGNDWQRVQLNDGQLMYADVKMPQMAELVWHVIERHGLVDFFFASLSDSEGQKDPRTGSGSREARTS